MRALVHWGQIAARAGDRASAYRLFLEALALEPTDAEAWLWRAGTAAEPAEAIACLERVLELDPANPRARRGLEEVRQRFGPGPAVEQPETSPLVSQPTTRWSDSSPWGVALSRAALAVLVLGFQLVHDVADDPAPAPASEATAPVVSLADGGDRWSDDALPVAELAERSAPVAALAGPSGEPQGAKPEPEQVRVAQERVLSGESIDADELSQMLAEVRPEAAPVATAAGSAAGSSPALAGAVAAAPARVTPPTSEQPVARAAERPAGPAEQPADRPPDEAAPPALVSRLTDAAIPNGPRSEAGKGTSLPWVAVHRATGLWSKPGHEAELFRTVQPGARFQIAKPQDGPRLYVWDPTTGNFAFIDAVDVGPGSPLRVQRRPLERGAVPPPPPERPWVAVHHPTGLWSGPEKGAQLFGPAQTGARFQVAGPQQGPRLPVWDPNAKNYAYIDAVDVGPAERPQTTTARKPKQEETEQEAKQEDPMPIKNAFWSGMARVSMYTCVELGGCNRTAMGIWPYEGVVAVDPRMIPLGSKVWIEGLGTFLAADTGSAIVGNRIDVYVDSYLRALQWGVRYLAAAAFG